MAVCDLLSGRTEQRLPLISSIPTADPEEMRLNVSDQRDRGYFRHSIKIGASEGEGGPNLDAQRIKACLCRSSTR
jgi:L-alanine-DL-glutamate epimerase-like enolase superfamily enzyme